MSEKLIDSKIIKKVDSLRLNSNMILHLGATGERKSTSKGSSVEFSDFREYIPGDDFRKIDWNAYMRFEKLFLKLFVEEREALVNIIIDNTMSMDFGDKNKLFLAKQLGGILSYVVLSGMDRVKIHYLDQEGLKASPYYYGKDNIGSIIHRLENMPPVSKGRIFTGIQGLNLKKGITIVLSDFWDEKVLESIRYLNYLKQDVVLIHILDHEEINPTVHGDLKLVDSETGEKVNVTVTEAVRKKYHSKYLDYVQEIKNECNKFGNKHMVISSDTPIDEILFDRLGKSGLLNW